MASALRASVCTWSSHTAAFIIWVNRKLAKVDRDPISDDEEEFYHLFQDGQLLAGILLACRGEKVRIKKSHHPAVMRSNIDVSLERFEAGSKEWDPIPMKDISAQDFLDGNTNHIMQFLWLLIKVHDPQYRGLSMEQLLEAMEDEEELPPELEEDILRIEQEEDEVMVVSGAWGNVRSNTSTAAALTEAAKEAFDAKQKREQQELEEKQRREHEAMLARRKRELEKGGHAWGGMRSTTGAAGGIAAASSEALDRKNTREEKKGGAAWGSMRGSASAAADAAAVTAAAREALERKYEREAKELELKHKREKAALEKKKFEERQAALRKSKQQAALREVEAAARKAEREEAARREREAVAQVAAARKRQAQPKSRMAQLGSGISGAFSSAAKSVGGLRIDVEVDTTRLTGKKNGRTMRSSIQL